MTHAADGNEPRARRPYELAVIGASTGGPRALVAVLSRLPADLGVPVLVAQHMPPGFTRTLAERLDRQCALAVREAGEGDALTPGQVLVAPGGRQVAVERVGARLVVRISDTPSDVLHHPSIDHLLDSVARVVGARAVGVILTGMGADGAHGLRAMRAAGARTIAESRETAVIYGMPRSAAESAEQILPLPAVGPALAALCAPARPTGGSSGSA